MIGVVTAKMVYREKQYYEELIVFRGRGILIVGRRPTVHLGLWLPFVMLGSDGNETEDETEPYSTSTSLSSSPPSLVESPPPRRWTVG